MAKICFFIHKGGVFPLHPRRKVLVKLFQKLAGLGSDHKNGVFFLPSFFFAPLVPKKKRDYEVRLYLMRGKKTLKKAFLPPNPHLSKILKRGAYFFVIITSLDRRTINVRTAPFNCRDRRPRLSLSNNHLGSAHKTALFFYIRKCRADNGSIL